MHKCKSSACCYPVVLRCGGNRAAACRSHRFGTTHTTIIVVDVSLVWLARPHPGRRGAHREMRPAHRNDFSLAMHPAWKHSKRTVCRSDDISQPILMHWEIPCLNRSRNRLFSDRSAAVSRKPSVTVENSLKKTSCGKGGETREGETFRVS